MKPLARTALLSLLAGACPALAQQKVSPPIATYWMSIETSAGLPMGAMSGGGGMSMMDIGRMALGGGMDGGPRHAMWLELGSSRGADGTPAAAHEIPPGLGMGPRLPLETPQKLRAEPREDGVPENFERPRGRMLIYWGCGEQAGPGQPYVVDFARLAQGEFPKGLFSQRVAPARGPSANRSRSYGEWPNPRDSTAVPSNASLIGQHTVKSSYAPTIDFALSEKYDFMAPVKLSMSRSAGGGMSVGWNAIAHAHGYFASAMGGKDGTEDVVFWSSSASREFGEQLMSWLPPGEVARLVRERVVLPPSASECTVPAAFVADAPAAILRFIAYGEEANFAHPPRPTDPKQPWNPEWAAKLRLKSTAAAMLGEEMPDGASAERGASERSGSGAPGIDPVQEGLKALKGLFGK